MWRKHPQFDETGITLISSLWPDSVPPYLDAVYQNVERNIIVFFKGKKKKKILKEHHELCIMHFEFSDEKAGIAKWVCKNTVSVNVRQ